MIELPKQLQNSEFRFLILQSKRKEPIAEMSGWQEYNMKFDDPFLRFHLEDGKNYAVIGGYNNLIIIDSDSEEITKLIEDNLPQTFTIKTGSPEPYKKHFFYITDKKMKAIRLSKNTVGDLGDVRATGQYVVGPNCIHPSGNSYQIEKDLQISYTTEERIIDVFKNYMGKLYSSEEKTFPILTEKRNSNYTRNCKMADYCLNNKLKGNTSKNWELFPYLVDILNARDVSNQIYQKLASVQDHSPGAIENWLKYAKNGTLAKSSCQKMRKYIERFHPDLMPEICEKCNLYFKKDNSKKFDESLFKYLIKTKLGTTVDIELFVQDMLSMIKIKTIYGKKGEDVYYYDEKDGLWHPNGKEIIKTETEKILKEYSKNNIVSEIYEKIKRKTKVSKKSFDNVVENLICLNNGVLNVETKELTPFNPDYNFKNKIYINYDEDTECQSIKKFIEETFYPDDVPVIEEWLGFHLYKKHFIKKAMILFGPKNTGKTQFINLLISFIGEENKTGISLHHISMGDKFTLAFLKDKLGNIYDDLSFNDLKDAGGFKIATGGGFVSAEHKFGDSFEFYNYAKNTFATNKIPAIDGETDDAYYLRWLPIPCDNEVIENEQDPFLLKKLIIDEEMSGLLNLALEGLQRLLKNGKFSFNKGVKEIKILMERHSNHLVAFVQDCLIQKNGNKITKDDMYEIYKKYAFDNSLKTYSKSQLGRRLDKIVSYMTSKHEKERYWENVDINPKMMELVKMLDKQEEIIKNTTLTTL